MTRFLATCILFVVFSSNGFGQSCNCLSNVNALERFVEGNQASFQHQVIEMKRGEAYAVFKKNINRAARHINTKRACIGLVARYVSFFRDEHSFLYYSDNSNTDHTIPTQKNRYSNSAHLAWMGRWYFQDGTMSIDVLPYSTANAKWIAVMNVDQSGNWKKGQVKIEFFEDDSARLKCIYWTQNLVPKVYPVRFTDSLMYIGRNLRYYRKEIQAKSQAPRTDSISFVELSAQAGYLRIPSFDLSATKSIDSILIVNSRAIQSKQLLVIDIRDNGGGGFDAFRPLLPLALNNRIYEEPYAGSVWVSKDNLNYYDTTKYSGAETAQDSTEELAFVTFLSKHIGRFSPTEKTTDTISLAADPPRKIALLYNRFTASSAEGFILTAKQSPKVTTFGEHSAGAVSYGDWRPFALPDLNIVVAVTTKKMIFAQETYFESIGISPDVNLSGVDENLWIDAVIKAMAP